MLCNNTPTKFVPKLVVSDLFICKLKFEIKLFNSCLHFHIKVKIIGHVTILFPQTHGRDLFKGNTTLITKFLGVSSFSRQSHYICPLCHIPTTIINFVRFWTLGRPTSIREGISYYHYFFSNLTKNNVTNICHKRNTTRNPIICNQSLCNWHATSCHLQL